jgi:two-component system chemotaxis response regulator CheY
MSKILIVDDALFVRRMIKGALEPLGFNIIGEAENGQVGLQMIEELKPDLVTLDIVMPEMDGIEMLSALRDKHMNTKVIMITAVDQRDMMLKAMKFGISDFIVKPFEEERVISAVEKALERPEEVNK